MFGVCLYSNFNMTIATAVCKRSNCIEHAEGTNVCQMLTNRTALLEVPCNVFLFDPVI